MMNWLICLCLLIGRVYSESCTFEEISAGIELHYKQVVLKIQWIDESTTMITIKEGDFNFPVNSLCTRIQADAENLSGFTPTPPLQESSESSSHGPVSSKEGPNTDFSLLALIFGILACLGLMVVGSLYIFNRCIKKRERRSNSRARHRVPLDLSSLPTSEVVRSEIPDFNSF